MNRIVTFSLLLLIALALPTAEGGKQRRLQRKAARQAAKCAPTYCQPPCVCPGTRYIDRCGNPCYPGPCYLGPCCVGFPVLPTPSNDACPVQMLLEVPTMGSGPSSVCFWVVHDCTTTPVGVSTVAGECGDPCTGCDAGACDCTSGPGIDPVPGGGTEPVFPEGISGSRSGLRARTNKGIRRVEYKYKPRGRLRTGAGHEAVDDGAVWCTVPQGASDIRQEYQLFTGRHATTMVVLARFAVRRRAAGATMEAEYQPLDDGRVKSEQEGYIRTGRSDDMIYHAVGAYN